MEDKDSFATSFLYPYYSASLDDLHKFYGENSLISRDGRNFVFVQDAATMKNLRPVPAGFNFEDRPRFELQQTSVGEKLQFHVLVSGFITSTSTTKPETIMFNQAMVLSPVRGRYIVESDIFTTERKPFGAAIRIPTAIGSGRRRQAHMIWDLAYNAIPMNVSPSTLWDKVETYLSVKYGVDLVSAVAFGDTNEHLEKALPGARVSLEKQGFSFHPMFLKLGKRQRKRKKQMVDFLISKAMGSWSWNSGRLGDALLICLGDLALAGMITNLLDIQLDPILAYSACAAQELIDSTPKKFPWAELFI